LKNIHLLYEINLKLLERKKISELDWKSFFNQETIGAKGLNAQHSGMEMSDRSFVDDFVHQGAIGLSFKNCLFEKKFTFFQIRPLTAIYFTDCTFLEDVCFDNLRSEHNKVSFLNCEFNELLLFSRNKLPRLEINVKYAKKILFDAESSFGTVQIGGMDKNKIDEIDFKANTILKRFELNHADVGNFSISFCTLEAELIISNCGIIHNDLINAA
jgi:hypothetical protein